MSIWETYGQERPYMLSGKSIFDDREELKWRLNQRLKGKDPGQPVNWKGL